MKNYSDLLRLPLGQWLRGFALWDVGKERTGSIAGAEQNCVSSWRNITAATADSLLSGMDFVLRRADQALMMELVG